jgi:flagellar motor switch protein FliN/FliY
MNNENEFNDPLADFDPVMESAFSINEEPPKSPIEEPSPPTEAPSNPPVSDDIPIDLNKDDSFFDNDESFDIDESLFEEKETGISVSKVQFEAPQSSTGESQTYDKNLFKNIKVDVSIELGRSKVSLKKLYELKSGAIIELGRLVGEPLDLVINDQVIARGEVVAVNSNYGIRITHVESLANLA